MQSYFKTGLKIGVLGGGQLGRMLIQEAINYNLEIAVLDPDENAPCRYLTSNFVKGDFKDYETVLNFGSNLDVLTIEIEHVNIDALKTLEKNGVKVFPQPNFLEIVQDKGLQKLFFKENNIPTAPFYLIENKSEINKHLNEFPFFQKMRKGGYDGKGVYKLDHENKISEAFDVPSVLEKLVPFEREISVIVSRNDNHQTSVFPVVDMDFNEEANLVEYLFAPSSLEISLQKKAQELALDIITKANMIGILAVEMFVTNQGDILVNEIAPRPHNSGHQTIEANITSQYEQHLRAICNFPPGKTDIESASVMVNILGEPNYTGDAIYEGMDEILDLPGVYVHLYGKKITKPFRKMGHVTITGNDLEEVKNIANKVKSKLKVKA